MLGQAFHSPVAWLAMFPLLPPRVKSGTARTSSPKTDYARDGAGKPTLSGNPRHQSTKNHPAQRAFHRQDTPSPATNPRQI
jgi:hypothetical protein